LVRRQAATWLSACDNLVDDVLDQHLVVALAHHAIMPGAAQIGWRGAEAFVVTSGNR
jgi:hypothetical protein